MGWERNKFVVGRKRGKSEQVGTHKQEVYNAKKRQDAGSPTLAV
jgi:hypothetical protein